MAINVLYTAHATSTGGRNGHTGTDNGLVSFDLSVPRSMDGPGKPGTTTPEDLFAAGYAACFGSAVQHAAREMKLSPTSMEIKAAVSIGKDETGGFRLKVDLSSAIGGVSQADAEKLTKEADQVCPYSKAIRGNVEVTLSAKAV
jgi:lipoyl-dependent peroxiredoxin